MMKYPKPTHRAIEKAGSRKLALKVDREQKDLVRERDRRRCRVCGRSTSEVHELTFKSKGGAASLQNSICACSVVNGGGLGHALLQSHVIRVIGYDANKDLLFEMDQRAAVAVFGHRSPPSHVRIV